MLLGKLGIVDDAITQRGNVLNHITLMVITTDAVDRRMDRIADSIEISRLRAEYLRNRLNQLQSKVRKLG
jgi:hypothetical protein